MGSPYLGVEDLWSFGADHVESKPALRRPVRGCRRRTSESAQHFRDAGRKEEFLGLDPI